MKDIISQIKNLRKREELAPEIKEMRQKRAKKIVLGVKIAIMVCLIVFTGIVTVSQWNNLYELEQWQEVEYDSSVMYANLSETDVLGQRFQADENYKLKTVGVFFATYGDSMQQGTVNFVFRDGYENVLYQESVDVTELRDNSYYNFDVNASIEQGGWYCYELTASGFEGSLTPLVWAGKPKNVTTVVYFAGNEQNLELLSRMTIGKYDSTPVLMDLVLLVLAGVLLFVPTVLGRKASNIAGTISLFVFPCVSVLLVESLYRNPFQMDFVTILFNYLLYLIIYLLCFFITGRFRAALLSANIFTFVIGVVNYYVLLFRGVPLCPWDIFSASTAAKVAGGYRYEVDLGMLGSILCMFATCFFIMHFHNDRVKWSIRVISGAASVVYAVVVVFLFVGTPLLEHQGFEADLWDQRTGYLHNGFFLSFAINMKYLQVEKPEGYEVKAVEEILDDYEEEVSEQYSEIKPNIIMIMNESYSDLTVIGDFETNIDYAPFLHSLTDNTVTGNLYVSVFGGGTCNTEFEVLTGNSMAYLAKGSIAYQQYISQSYATGGLVATLKKQGYTCYAMHPLAGANWNRNNVYISMGFDKFYDVTSFPKDAELIRSSFISDRESYKKVIELYEEKQKGEPLFIFDVTVQNHGGYETHSQFENPVTIESMKGDYPKTEEYLSLLKVSDEAFAELVEHFSQVSEPTMIVMFGDHQPAIEDEFYEELYGKSLTQLDLSEVQKRYEVPFYIWTNYDIEEAVVEQMSANYLSGTVLSYTGLPISKYFAFENAMYQDIPIININGYRDASGQDHTLDDAGENAKWLGQYSILCYNNVIDRSHTWYPMYLSEKK